LPLVRLAIDNYHRAYSFLPSMQATREHLGRCAEIGTRRGGVPIAGGLETNQFRDVAFAYEGRAIVAKVSMSIGRENSGLSSAHRAVAKLRCLIF